MYFSEVFPNLFFIIITFLAKLVLGFPDSFSNSKIFIYKLTFIYSYIHI